MIRALSRLTVLLGVLLLVEAPGAAQVPKVGEWYEDSADCGFRIKRAKGYDLIPPSPLERNLIATFSPPNGVQVSVGEGDRLGLATWLVKFDRRPESKVKAVEREVDGTTVTISNEGQPNIHEWMKNSLPEGAGWSFDKKAWPKTLKNLKTTHEIFLFEGQSRAPLVGSKPGPIKAYVGLFHLSDDLEVAFIGIGPGDEKKWIPYERTYEDIAKSFGALEIEKSATTATDALSPRGRRRADLEQTIRTQPGWTLYETPNYFIISNNEDKEFMEELQIRLEAIRAVYEEHYPYTKARQVERPDEPNAPRTGEGEAPEGGAEGEAAPERAKVNALDLSRCSVVRVCATQEQYMKYGGPGGSAGYWNSVEEELVVYDDKMSGGRADTWSVLNHEAFHQYTFYFYGNLAPHSWYNEGTGDFYGGYELKNKRFVIKEFAWRIRTAQQMIREGLRTPDEDAGYVPLEEFLRWTQAEYYGTNDYKQGGGESYAQGWSVIWFLRTGPKKAKNWQPEWGKILDVYLETLVSTGELEEAMDAAFAGVDWAAFEAAWKDYIG